MRIKKKAEASKKSELKIDLKRKNFTKKPANGGTPAKEKNSKDIKRPNVKL